MLLRKARQHKYEGSINIFSSTTNKSKEFIYKPLYSYYLYYKTTSMIIIYDTCFTKMIMIQFCIVYFTFIYLLKVSKIISERRYSIACSCLIYGYSHLLITVNDGFELTVMQSDCGTVSCNIWGLAAEVYCIHEHNRGLTFQPSSSFHV